MNKIILIGNLTRDPETSMTSSGITCTKFSLAVNRPFVKDNGERVADYFDIITWRNLAERCSKYLYKGCKVGISGWVQRRQYEDRDGIRRTTFDVVADEVEFLSQKPNDENPPSNQRSDTKQVEREIARPTTKTSRGNRNMPLLDGMQEVDPTGLPF